MRIAFDARMAFHSGIGAHIRGLLRALNQSSHPPNLTILGDLNQLISQNFHQNFKVQSYTAPIYSPWNQFWFPRQLEHAEALHTPHYNIPYRYCDPMIVTIHDLIHILFPQFVGSAAKKAYAKYTFHKIGQKAQLILCVSEHTRQDVMERLNVTRDRTMLLPNAVDESFQPTDDAEALTRFRKAHRLPSQYILSVGINKSHKNFLFLLRSLYHLWTEGKLSAPLVVAGCGQDKEAFLRSVQSLDVAKWVIMVGWLEFHEMPLLYQGADALVFPSLYEGFGLPLLEAQRMGVPIASSNAASLPEVAGSGALFFDPADEESCADAVMKVLTDSDLRQTLTAEGRINEAKYSWTESARLLMESYGTLS